MDRFAELNAFVAVTEAGGFAAAARELGQSRSAINRLVLALEQRLGLPLLNRTTRNVSPTSDGRAFYAKAKRILDDLDEAETALGAAHEEAIGQMRINGPVSQDPINISRAVVDFMKIHPKVRIDLTLESRLVDPVAEGFDLVVRVDEPDETTMMVDHRLAEFEYMCCASPDYVAAHGAPSAPEALSEHALLHFHGAPHMQTWRFQSGGASFEVTVSSRLCSNNIEPILEACKAGLGVAVLPGIAVREALQAGDLTRLLGAYSLPRRVLQVIYPPNRHLSAKVRLFTDFLCDRFS
ncbi:MAG: LysR family transcriptional regulator [Pseudomonadota bacterium]